MSIYFPLVGYKTVIRSVCQAGLLNCHLCVISAMSLNFSLKVPWELFPVYWKVLLYLKFMQNNVRDMWYNSELQLLWMMCLLILIQRIIPQNLKIWIVVISIYFCVGYITEILHSTQTCIIMWSPVPPKHWGCRPRVCFSNRASDRVTIY